jgi:hypothetical protein
MPGESDCSGPALNRTGSSVECGQENEATGGREMSVSAYSVIPLSESRSSRMASRGDTAVVRALQADRMCAQALLG